MSNLEVMHALSKASSNWSCGACRLRDRCLAAGLNSEQTARLDQVVIHNRNVERHGAVCRAGTPFHYLYAIRSGFVKSTMGQADGRDQVTGIYMPGELIGIDAIDSGTYACDLVALEDCNVCAISFADLERVSRDIPALQRYFYRVLSREITRDYRMMLWLGSLHIEERIALFLLNLSERYAAQGSSHTHFSLLLTRHEIGSYLGTTLETVSRVLSRFQEAGLIEVQNKEMTIKNLEKLQGMVDQPAEIKRFSAHRPLRRVEQPGPGLQAHYA